MVSLALIFISPLTSEFISPSLFSPALYYSTEAQDAVRIEIIDRTILALKAEGIDFKGILYFGIMLTDNGPKLLEYNVRFGDPETEVILPRLQSDLVDIMLNVIDGKLDKTDIKWSTDKAICIVMASGGYPEKYQVGCDIKGIEKVKEGAIVFHAGTKFKNDKLVTAGGRVLVISALDKNYEVARKMTYEAIDMINFQDLHYRTDIAICD